MEISHLKNVAKKHGMTGAGQPGKPMVAASFPAPEGTFVMPCETKDAENQVKREEAGIDITGIPCGNEDRPEPKVSKAMQQVLPPLSANARTLLKEKIQKDGPQAPIFLASKDGVILDGHARLEIYQELGIPDYPVVWVDVEAADERKLWRCVHNIGARRNLNAYQKAVAALQFLDYFQKKARDNQRRSGKGKAVAADERVDALAEVARIAGVSRDTINKVRCIDKWITHLPKERQKEIRTALETGKKSINSAYSDTKRANRISTRKRARKNRSGARYDNPSQVENAILCLNAVKGLKKIDDAAVTLVFTSPPYHGIGTDYGGVYKEKKNYREYLDWLDQVWKECSRILRPGGRLVINVDATRNREDDSSYAYPIYADLVKRITDTDIGLLWRDEYVWVKQNLSGKKSALGSRQCPCSRRNHEYLLCFSKERFDLPYIEGIPSDLTDDEFNRYTMSTWQIPPASKKNNEHPHPFPDELARRVIKLFSYPRDWVCDPFVGGGTVTAVAASLDRRYTGIDLNPDYCLTATERTKAARATPGAGQ